MAKGTFQKLKASEAPRRKRRSSSRMDALPQWKLMREDITKYEMVSDEVRQITVTPEDKAKYDIKSRRTMIRTVTKFLVERNLPARVVSFTRDGVDFIQVRHDKKSR